MPRNNGATIQEVYQLVDRRMSEVNGSVQRLEDKFDRLEAGRLSSVEKNVANIQGRMMYIPILITMAMNAFFFIMNYFLK